MRVAPFAVLGAALIVGAAPAAAQSSGRPLLTPPPMDGSVGATVFAASCAECHMGEGSTRAPRLTALSAMTPRAILTALEDGRMRRHGEQLAAEERVSVSEWLTGKALTETRLSSSAFCAAGPSSDATVHWSGWGGGAGESGFVDAGRAGLTAEDLPDLELAWAFAFPDASQVRSKPAVIGDRLIVGSAYGEVYSIDKAQCCFRHLLVAGDLG